MNDESFPFVSSMLPFRYHYNHWGPCLVAELRSDVKSLESKVDASSRNIYTNKKMISASQNDIRVNKKDIAASKNGILVNKKKIASALKRGYFDCCNLPVNFICSSIVLVQF